MLLEKSEFTAIAEKTLGRWLDRFEDVEGFDEVELTDGVLTATTDAGKTFVLSRHLPTLQIWLSSATSGAHHYTWDDFHADWRDTRTNEALSQRLIEDLASLDIVVDDHV